jgi:hypothetical protein
VASKEKLRSKAKRFHRIFTSPDGEKVLQDIQSELERDELFDDNPHRTAYNCGRRDAFIYIKQLVRYEENARRLEE